MASRGGRAPRAIVACVLGPLMSVALHGPLLGPTAALAADAAASARCDCAHFADELAAAQALFASRGEGATLELPPPARARFRERVLGTYARARCLVACANVPDRERDDARTLLAAAAFKSRELEPKDADAPARLAQALDETAHCLTHEPAPPACHLYEGSIRGILALGSWNPLQLGLPKQLLVEFRAARAGAAPGDDPPDGAATRAEATLLLRAPRVAGGDVDAARRLMETATRSPLYPCTVDNSLTYAETLTRTGAPERAVAELRTALASGLPTCGDNRYENASDLEEAARCLRRLETHPADDPGWDNDCS